LSRPRHLRCPRARGLADPFNGHIDEFRISHVQRSDGWIETTWKATPVPLPWQGSKSRKAAMASRHRSPVWSSA
jgi:hypothetical protein